MILQKSKSPTKPVVGIADIEVMHPLFYKQFLKYYELLKEDQDNFNKLVLSGLFLYLTLESYLTWVIRWLLNNVNRSKNRKLMKIWQKHYEPSANLYRKVEFFEYAFLDSENTEEIKQIIGFVQDISKLRNKIVHGHEFSIIRWSDGNFKKSKFAEVLTIARMQDYYNEFNNCIGLMPTLVKRIDIQDLTSGLPSKEWVYDFIGFSKND